MATLSVTQNAPVVPADIPIANLLRVAMQRVVDGEDLDAEARRVLGTFVQFAMAVPATDPSPLAVSIAAYATPARTSKYGQVGEGFYRTPNGTYVKVQMNQVGTRTYAKRWEHESWEYDSGLIRHITTDMKLTAQDAKEWGELYGRCIFCSQQLNDERSIAAGYGEICAQNHGLPWG